MTNNERMMNDVEDESWMTNNERKMNEGEDESCMTNNERTMTDGEDESWMTNNERMMNDGEEASWMTNNERTMNDGGMNAGDVISCAERTVADDKIAAELAKVLKRRAVTEHALQEAQSCVGGVISAWHLCFFSR